MWKQYRAEDLATPGAFARDPKLVWEWYDWRRSLIAEAKPNPGHYALAAAEARARKFTLITQNVDGLHELAGSRNVLRLHGSIWMLRCMACQREREDRRTPLPEIPPRCECGGMLRPGVVWFGEALPTQIWQDAETAAREADLFLLIGTSAVVYPAAGLALIAKSSGARVVEINIAETGSLGFDRRISARAVGRAVTPIDRMKICYLDAFSGISGDMTVGALIDAGADSEALVHSLEGLGTGAKFEVEKTKRRGIAASKFRVIGGDGKTHRHLNHILEIIASSGISDRAKQNASAVFQRLGEAEAKVHDVSIEKVHFHEVGAVDSICDIVGACIGFDLLDIGAVYSSAVNVGSGTVKTEHGVLPVPAPATAELLTGKPIYARGPSLELTTPTGAAIASTLAIEFGPPPPMRRDRERIRRGRLRFSRTRQRAARPDWRDQRRRKNPQR